MEGRPAFSRLLPEARVPRLGVPLNDDSQAPITLPLTANIKVSISGMADNVKGGGRHKYCSPLPALREGRVKNFGPLIERTKPACAKKALPSRGRR